jgi:hypothetical protein
MMLFVGERLRRIRHEDLRAYVETLAPSFPAR